MYNVIDFCLRYERLLEESASLSSLTKVISTEHSSSQAVCVSVMKTHLKQRDRQTDRPTDRQKQADLAFQNCSNDLQKRATILFGRVTSCQQGPLLTPDTSQSALLSGVQVWPVDLYTFVRSERPSCMVCSSDYVQ